MHRKTSGYRKIALLVATTAMISSTALAVVGSTGARAEPGSARTAAHKARKAGDRARPAGEAASTTGALEGVVNLNTATVDELLLLPGVGPTKAERIVAWRAKNKQFKRVKDLRRVKGFGYKTLKKLGPYLTVKGKTTLSRK